MIETTQMKVCLNTFISNLDVGLDCGISILFDIFHSDFNHHIESLTTSS